MDGREVDRESVTTLKDIILGPQGTYVTLTFARVVNDKLEVSFGGGMEGGAEGSSTLMCA